MPFRVLLSSLICSAGSMGATPVKGTRHGGRLGPCGGRRGPPPRPVPRRRLPWGARSSDGRAVWTGCCGGRSGRSPSCSPRSPGARRTAPGAAAPRPRRAARRPRPRPPSTPPTSPRSRCARPPASWRRCSPPTTWRGPPGRYGSRWSSPGTGSTRSPPRSTARPASRRPATSGDGRALLVPRLSDYPHWFAALVERREADNPRARPRTAVLVLMRDAEHAPWRLAFSALLDEDREPPSVALDDEGYATALATRDESIKISPHLIGAVHATIAEEGTVAFAKGLFAPGPYTTGYYTEITESRRLAKERDCMNYDSIFAATTYPVYALRREDGGALVFYSLNRTTTWHPVLKCGEGRRLEIPEGARWLLVRPVDRRAAPDRRDPALRERGAAEERGRPGRGDRLRRHGHQGLRPLSRRRGASPGAAPPHGPGGGAHRLSGRPRAARPPRPACGSRAARPRAWRGRRSRSPRSPTGSAAPGPRPRSSPRSTGRAVPPA